ncbi:unnamed protein product, partial [Polarella glacialis]
MPTLSSSRSSGRMGKSAPGSRRSSCSSVQVISHLATFYSIGIFAAIVQPAWQQEPRESWVLPLIGVFWLTFLIDLALYSYVCLVDTRYKEALPGFPTGIESSFEPRMCDDCGCEVTHLRVKHCQTCGFCMEGFDHHCRYLNTCVGGRTYPAWYAFVALLLLLLATCAYGAIEALLAPVRYELYHQNPAVFWGLIGSGAA